MNHNEGDDKRMAIKGLGMDAVELSRIEKIVAEPKSFLEKVLTPKGYRIHVPIKKAKPLSYLNPIKKGMNHHVRSNPSKHESCSGFINY